MLNSIHSDHSFVKRAVLENPDSLSPAAVTQRYESKVKYRFDVLHDNISKLVSKFRVQFLEVISLGGRANWKHDMNKDSDDR